jgi:hypothetical protein
VCRRFTYDSIATRLSHITKPSPYRFHILSKNIYNFDEKGFLIGLVRKYKRIMTAAQLLIKQLMGASQDGNRENITFMVIICVNGSRIPPVLIY